MNHPKLVLHLKLDIETGGHSLNHCLEAYLLSTLVLSIFGVLDGNGR